MDMKKILLYGGLVLLGYVLAPKIGSLPLIKSIPQL